MNIKVLSIAVVLATPLSAQTLDKKTAETQLFPAEGYTVTVSPELSEDEQKLLRGIVDLSNKDPNQQSLNYYAAIAYSPDGGLQGPEGTLQSAANHHSAEAAERAALAACDALRPKSAKPCAIGANIYPVNFSPRALQLSQSATVAFQKSYRGLRAKALAISPSTGAFAVAKGRSAGQASLTSCNTDTGGANDCQVVIQD